MKISNYISILAVMVFFLSSCGSLSISQKRYSRGLNIGWFSPKEEKGAAQKASVRKSRKVESVLVAEAPATKEELVIGESKKESFVLSPVASPSIVKPEAVKSSTVKASKQVKAKSALGSKIVTSIKANASKMMQKAPLKIASANSVDATHDSDVNLLILIILAIVIPPLAVYLYFGEINIHFWLCLLLCFVGFGVLHLYWGFGALYALLTVFGIFG
jgi:uncharacterized membrane protein YqaE (UPF0057 family)